MTRFTDNLWSDLVREHGPALAHADRAERGRARRRRSGVVAGSTLGLAGVGTALIVAFTAGGASPAYAITNSGNGSLLVTINRQQGLPQANEKLAAMGINERISIQMASGPASVSGPVSCAPSPAGASLPGPQVKVLVASNGTEIIPSGGTGSGTWHLASCSVSGESDIVGSTGWSVASPAASGSTGGAG